MGRPGSSDNSAALAVPCPHLRFGLSSRRFVQIPSDVNKCLDRPEAWVHTGPNLPPSILEDVIARCVKETKVGTRKGKERVSPQPASLVSVERAEVSSSPVPSAKRTPTQSKAKLDGDNEVVASGTPIPWTPSPPSHLHPPNRQRELVTAVGTPSRHSRQQARPLAAKSHSSRAVFPTDFPPSSSQASETGLELEVPRAITDVLEPVNRQAVPVLEPTPPSAQIIPSTIVEESNPVQRHEATRRRRMKNPAAVFAELDSVSQSHAPGVTVPKAAIAASSGAASPLITTTFSASKPQARHARGTSPVPPSGDDRHHSTPVRQSVATTIPQSVSNRGFSSFAVEVPPNSPPNVPFIAFKLAYPDYQATLKDFIRAVKCLLKYQKDKALSEFLYDDFIRVFCGDYLAYIRSLSEGQAACPALRWYNANVSRPFYFGGVINKKNLTEIPKQYPEEFGAIQQGSAMSGTRSQAIETGQIVQRPAVGIGRTPVVAHDNPANTAATPDAEVSTHKAISTHKAVFSSNTIPTAESSRPIQDSRKILSQIDDNAKVPGSPSAGQKDSRTERIAKVIDNVTSSGGFPQSRVDSSLPVFETPQAPRVADMRREVASIFPSTMPSQISNPDSIPEMPNKRKLAPRASTGSSAVGAGAVFKRPRKETEDLEKRTLRFQKFLMQRRTQGSTPQSSKPP